MARMALQILQAVTNSSAVKMRHRPHETVKLRIGIHSGRLQISYFLLVWGILQCDMVISMEFFAIINPSVSCKYKVRFAPVW